MLEFTLNGQKVQTDAAPDTPLLWVIREHFELTGTKFGCGKGLCGACTVHFNGAATRSCIMPISVIANQSITTIEGVDEDHPVKQAWIDHQVPQCGYCQSGQIMSAVSLLSSNPSPSKDEIRGFMNGNICRCGTYNRIYDAIESASTQYYDASKPSEGESS